MMEFSPRLSGAAVAVALAVLTSCASSGPPLQRLGPDELWSRGVEQFEARKWQAAIDAFERLALEYPTHPRVEEARFRIGESYMNREEYLTATSEFLRLVTDYPTSELADDARLKACEAYVALSPKIPLDQEYTRAAIDHCQALVAYYPDSDLAVRAREIVARMRAKLAEKVLYSGNFYMRRGAFDSAIVYFEDVATQYADTPVAPKALYQLVQVYEELGYEDEEEAAKQRLLQQFPDSEEAQEVRRGSLAAGG